MRTLGISLVLALVAAVVVMAGRPADVSGSHASGVNSACPRLLPRRRMPQR